MTIEIVAGILFTGGVLTIEAIAAKLGEAFKAMASLLIGILKAQARIVPILHKATSTSSFFYFH